MIKSGIIFYIFTLVVGLTLESSSEPWYYGYFGNGRSTLNFQTQTTPTSIEPSASSRIDSFLIRASSTVSKLSASIQPSSTKVQSTTLSVSSSSVSPTPSTTTTSSESTEEWYQPLIPSFLTGFQPSTRANSTSSSSDDVSNTSEVSDSTDETESNSDGDGKRNPYTPYNVTCPKDLARRASGLSSKENSYIQSRYEITNKNLIDFLDRANISNFDSESFINDNSNQHNITIGLAYSGGGYRAMLSGSGQLLALDDRHDESKDLLGGLLQSSTYLVGLSGGSWLVGSLVLNDWMSIDEILGDSSLWQLENSLLNPSGIDIPSNIEYYYALAKAVMEKQDAGFETSLTDIWGRALSHQFFDDDNGGSNVTWSSIRDMENFKNHQMPYPIVLANGKYPDTLIVNANSTIFEISPYEFGSWDKSLNSFIDTKYIGSNLDNGGNGSCIENYDNSGFIMGTSSSIFNEALIKLNDYEVNSIIKTILINALAGLSNSKDDIAVYPNSFYNMSSSNSESLTSNSSLFLVDGGEDGENIPFYPLIQNDRSTDIIFGFDNSADTNSNWPNGTSIVETYKRQFSDQGKGTPFPFVPDIDTFLKDELTKKPVFFGCEASNLTDLVKWHNNENINETDVPLIVYIANVEQSYPSNFSTFKLSFDNDEKSGTIQNGFDTMTRGNLTDDENWLTCVGCAIIKRQQERLGIEQSDDCKECFKEYCWTGGFDQGAKVNVTLSNTSNTRTNNTHGYTNSTHSTNKTSSTTSQAQKRSSTTSINSETSASDTNTGSTSDRSTVDAQSQSRTTSSINNSAGLNFYSTYSLASRSTIEANSSNAVNQGGLGKRMTLEKLIFNVVTGLFIFM